MNQREAEAILEKFESEIAFARSSTEYWKVRRELIALLLTAKQDSKS